MKQKIEDIRGIADISGFGKNTSYEKGCQDMLQAGYEWLVKHRGESMNSEKQKIVNKLTDTQLKVATYSNIYGVLEPKSYSAKALSKAICIIHPGCTGAMHQAVFGHLLYINTNGIDMWKKEVVKK